MALQRAQFVLFSALTIFFAVFYATFCAIEPFAMELGHSEALSARSVFFSTRTEARIRDHYIFTVEQDTDPHEIARELGVKPRHIYKLTVNGFAGAVTPSKLLAIAEDPRIVSIEPDTAVKTQLAQQTFSTPYSTGAESAAFSRNFIQRSPPSWGLDRIDERSLPLSSSYSFDATGFGVNIYVIDTGIRYTHSEFGDRASFGFDAFNENGVDCHGHGTHVAGIAGGKTFGVAKKANLIAVRVLDCDGSGTLSDVISGVEWVARNRELPAVANLSLGGLTSKTLDLAVRKMIRSGVTTAVAAGNENADACISSPSRVLEAITIAASSPEDRRARFSNYGNCVDFFAPGTSILSAWSTRDNSQAQASGTSMAAPHVAGTAALYLEHHPFASPSTVRGALYRSTTKDIVLDARTANNHLLYSRLPSED